MKFKSQKQHPVKEASTFMESSRSMYENDSQLQHVHQRAIFEWKRYYE